MQDACDLRICLGLFGGRQLLGLLELDFDHDINVCADGQIFIYPKICALEFPCCRDAEHINARAEILANLIDSPRQREWPCHIFDGQLARDCAVTVSDLANIRRDKCDVGIIRRVEKTLGFQMIVKISDT